MTFIRDFVFLLLLIITVQKGEAENDCETDTIKVKNHFNMVYEAVRVFIEKSYWKLARKMYLFILF